MSRRRPPLMYRLRQTVARVGQWLANLGAALVSPIERLTAAIGGKFFAASERLNEADSLLLGIGRLLAWPFRMLGRLGAILLPESVRSALAWPLVKLWQLIVGAGGGLWRLAEKLNLDGLMLWIAWLTKPIWRPLAGIGGFIYAWFATRRYKELVWGLPAAALLLPIAGAATWGLLWGSAQAVERYKVALRDAVEAKDYARMQLYESKLSQLGADTRHSDYKTAEALAEEGKLDEAYARMQRLAPEDHASFAPAHAWILQRLLANELQVDQAERLRLAGVHLGHLKRLGIKSPQMDFLRAIWLAQSQRLEEAAQELAPLIGKLPFAAMERMRIDVILNNVEEARRDAFAVRSHMQDAKRRGETITADHYRSWVVAEELMGDAASLAPVVREWQTLAPDDPTARRTVALLDMRQFNETIREPNANPRELADQIVEMVQMSASPSEYQPQLAQLFRQRKQAPIIDALINELITDPKTPLSVTDALGTAAALQGEIELSRTLLRRVVDAQPGNAVAWNNYAWALMQEPQKDLDLAQAAISHALAIMPTEFRFRETRGQLLIQLGQWQQAVDDLEFALNGMPEAKAVHQSLAAAYDKLGQADLAQMHREQAR